MAIRVITIHDEVSAAGIGSLLRGSTFHVRGSASTLPGAIALARREQPRIALVELDLPAARGEEVVAGLRVALPQIMCVALTAVVDPSRILAAFRAGAAGYLLAPLQAANLVAALEVVALGRGAPVCARAAKVLLDELRRRTDAIPERTPVQLSRREREVLTLVARGWTDVEIGEALGIKKTTVQTYLDRVYEKLGVTRRAEAAFHAGGLGLIELDRERAATPSATMVLAGAKAAV
jgi:DNA-binding NarL/FixJ family response regulator